MKRFFTDRDVEIDFLRGVAIIGFAFWHGGVGGSRVSWCVPLFVYCTAALSVRLPPTFQRAIRQSEKVLAAVVFCWGISWMCRAVSTLGPSVTIFGCCPKIGLLWYLVLHIQILLALPLMVTLNWRHVPLLLLASQAWLVTSSVFHLGFLNIPLVSWLPWIVISREIHVRLGEKIHSASVFQSWIWMGACAAMGAAAYAMPSFAALVGKHLYEQWWYLLPLNAWAAIGGALLFRLLGAGGLMVSAVAWIGRQTLIVYIAYEFLFYYADRLSFSITWVRVPVALTLGSILSVVFERIYRGLMCGLGLWRDGNRERGLRRKAASGKH